MIDGVVLHPLHAHCDARGSFLEVYADVWKLAIFPRQWSLVQSRPGTLRGMHLHLRHDECVVPVAGRAFVGLHDLRAGSATEGEAMLVEICGERPTALVFPCGIVHGWYFPEGGIHLQAVSEPYSEYAGDDNLGCHYADPELGIDWPGVPSLVSARALAFPPLSKLRERFRERTATSAAGAA